LLTWSVQLRSSVEPLGGELLNLPGTACVSLPLSPPHSGHSLGLLAFHLLPTSSWKSSAWPVFIPWHLARHKLVVPLNLTGILCPGPPCPVGRGALRKASSGARVSHRWIHTRNLEGPRAELLVWSAGSHVRSWYCGGREPQRFLSQEQAECVGHFGKDMV
jgi:hypothetical protein